MHSMPKEFWWILGIVVLIIFFGAIWFTQWRMVRRVKRKYDKKDYELAKDREKPRHFKYTWDGVFGFLFFMGAAIMGASLLIRALMLFVGILVGHLVKGVVEGLKVRKNVSRKNK